MMKFYSCVGVINNRWVVPYIITLSINIYFWQFRSGNGVAGNAKLMKMLACKDIGGNDDFVAKGETEDEVMMKMEQHIKEMHPEMMTGMSEEEMMKMKEESKMKIKDAM